MCRANQEKRRSATFAEVAKHNSKESCWVTTKGKVYDVTNFVETHPGGQEMLLLAAGREVTTLMASYHPFTNKPEQILEKYYLCDLESTKTSPTDNCHIAYNAPKGREDFYATLSKRVDAHFKSTGTNPKWSTNLGLRIVGLALWFVASYYATFYAGLGFWGGLLAAASLGLYQAIYSLQLMHDSSHCSVTHKPWVWKSFGIYWDLTVGAHFHAWLTTHTVGHHSYTNVRGLDPDLSAPEPEVADLRRVAPGQKWYGHYKFQHLYMFLLYPLLTFKFRIDDSVMQSTQKSSAVPMNYSPLWFAVWVVGKLSYATLRGVLPYFYGTCTFNQWVVYNILIELVTGTWLTFNFQVSHVVEGLKHYDAMDGTVEEEWGVTQVVTAMNYSMDNAIWTYLCGALNFQIEHHLFPGVNQTHYPAIAPIVQQTCKEYNVPYTTCENFPKAVWAHMKYVANMADPDFKPAQPTVGKEVKKQK